MKKKPTKNEILLKYLDLVVCKDTKAVCVYGFVCYYSIPFFKRASDPEPSKFCKRKVILVRVNPKPCIMLPIFTDNGRSKSL